MHSITRGSPCISWNISLANLSILNNNLSDNDTIRIVEYFKNVTSVIQNYKSMQEL